MNELVTKDNIKIEDMIYEIRGKQVILAIDVANLYGTDVRSVNQVVKRNINRFPDNFCFQLTKQEFDSLKSQFVISKHYINQGRGGNRFLPYAFTEHGVMMLSGLLKSTIAAEINVKIINAFIAMRKYISVNLIEQEYINNLVLEDHNRINLLEESFDKFEENKEVNEIYFDGKIYDAYSKIMDIFSEAKEELIIIDRYTDKTILDMIKNLDCRVILITSKNTKLSKLDIEKYNKSYHNLSIIYNDTYHDRYFILDKNKIYHSGNSINHIGYRKSSINVLEDDKIKRTIIEDIEKIIEEM